MKFILFTFLIFCSLTNYGQTCDTIDGKLINCIDKKGNKQGYWEYANCDTSLTDSYWRDLGNWNVLINCIIQSKGKYKNNKKTGKWQYYSKIYPGVIEKKITYFDDGSTKYEHLSNKYVLNINKDTSEIKGDYYSDIDNVKILCEKSQGKLILSNNKELYTFQFKTITDLENVLARLVFGDFDREIKKKTGKW